MIDYLAHVRADADRIAKLAGAALDVPVPSCPGWVMADLVGHVGVVYDHKLTIVRDGWIDEQPEPVDPPTSGLLAWFHRTTTEMLRVLASAEPTAPAATWYAPNQTVGFWQRRMAHESVIHRLDAELAHDVVTPIDAALGADGIDEILAIMMTGAPEWSVTSMTDRVITVTEVDGSQSWRLRLAAFTGTSPGGTLFEDEATFFIDYTDDPAAASIAGPAGAVDAWLWGRGELGDLSLDGDRDLVDLVRNVAVESTQ